MTQAGPIAKHATHNHANLLQRFANWATKGIAKSLASSLIFIIAGLIYNWRP